MSPGKEGPLDRRWNRHKVQPLLGTSRAGCCGCLSDHPRMSADHHDLDYHDDYEQAWGWS